MQRFSNRTVALALFVGLAVPAGQAAAQNAEAQKAEAPQAETQNAAMPEAETSEAAAPADSIEERNKALARGFYEDLWFSDNTDRYERYLADQYVVHDTGERKGVTEPAIRQKEIADFFHSQGEMTGSIDYQIAEGDLVATRWQWKLEPTSLMFKIMGGRDQIPIINVFRFNDEGKIVEIWNHRHDIDTGVANFKFLKGLGVGLVVALLGWGVAFLLRRRKRTPGVALIVTCVVGTLAACSGPTVITEAEVDEFRRMAESYQSLYMDGGENCDEIVPFLAEDIRMLENGEEWSHEQMEQYCPYLPQKEVLSSWADVDVLRPDLAYDFATAVYQVEENPPGRETAARVWEKIGGDWKIVHMTAVRGPIRKAPSAR